MQKSNCDDVINAVRRVKEKEERMAGTPRPSKQLSKLTNASLARWHPEKVLPVTVISKPGRQQIIYSLHENKRRDLLAVKDLIETIACSPQESELLLSDLLESYFPQLSSKVFRGNVEILFNLIGCYSFYLLTMKRKISSR